MEAPLHCSVFLMRGELSFLGLGFFFCFINSKLKLSV